MNQQIKREVESIKSLWNNDPNTKINLKQNHPELANLLEKGDNNALEKMVGDRLKAQFEERKKE